MKMHAINLNGMKCAIGMGEQRVTNRRNTSTPTCSLHRVDRHGLFIAVDIFVGYFIIFPCARRDFIGQNVSRQAINHFIWMSDRARAQTHTRTRTRVKEWKRERANDRKRGGEKQWNFEYLLHLKCGRQNMTSGRMFSFIFAVNPFIIIT